MTTTTPVAPVEPTVRNVVPSSVVRLRSWVWPATTTGTQPATPSAWRRSCTARRSGRSRLTVATTPGLRSRLRSLASSVDTRLSAVNVGSPMPRTSTSSTRAVVPSRTVMPVVAAKAARFSSESWFPGTKR